MLKENPYLHSTKLKKLVMNVGSFNKLHELFESTTNRGKDAF